jgi:hypothetical protein
MRQDVVRRSCGVAFYNQPADNCPGDEVQKSGQLQAACNSGLEAWRCFDRMIYHLQPFEART